MQDHWTYRSGEVKQHFIQNCLHGVLQRAYKQNNITESVLFKIQNDFLMAIDIHGEQSPSWLILSGAFDIIESTILLLRLHGMGIRDVPLDWFRSNWRQWRQSVVINGTRSSYRNLSFEVLQGSLFGRIIFTLYTTQLNAIARWYQWNFHSYASDTAVHDLQTNNMEAWHQIISNTPKSCHWHQVLDDANML